jgi:hypothetical protein
MTDERWAEGYGEAYTANKHGALLSDDGRYRYRLWRRLRSVNRYEERRFLVVMLNPSTADASVDDATVRRCRAFAVADGATVLEVVNLFALRARDPTVLLRPMSAVDRAGPMNDRAIAAAVGLAHRVVVAWGIGGDIWRTRALEVQALIRASGLVPHSIGPPTKNGQPRHPLYLRRDSPLQPWEPT